MSKLYIANCTRQYWNCQYRLDFTKEGEAVRDARFLMAKSQTIPPGRQVALGGDLHITQINDVVEQLRGYGLVGVADVPSLRGKKAPYVFNVDVPVSAATIRKVVDHNDGISIIDGKTRREKAAVAANDIVSSKIDDTKLFEVEYEQLEQSEAGEKTIGEGYRMDPNAPPPNKRQRRRQAA